MRGAENPKRAIVRQFVRFAAVGVANTAVYYLAYRFSLMFLPYLVAHVLAWAVATVFSFYFNAYFTFRTRPTVRKLLAFPLSSLVNLVISTAVSFLLVSVWGASATWGTLVGGLAAVPFTFLVVRLIFLGRPRSSGGSTL